ncbi:MAG: preprotein translocase subunit SecG [Dehalococcoidia bacterium]
MAPYLQIVQILVSIALVLVILLQVRSQGGGIFGQAQSTYRVRRGMERTLFQLTIFLVVVFIAIAIINVRFT